MHQETITHLTEGLAALDLFPESPARAQQELTLRLALGAPLIASKGHASPEVEQTYARARELCRLLGKTPQLFPVLWGLAVNATVRGELRLAREVSEHLLQRAQTLQDTALQLEAYLLSGALALWLGEVEEGRVQLE